MRVAAFSFAALLLITCGDDSTDTGPSDSSVEVIVDFGAFVNAAVAKAAEAKMISQVALTVQAADMSVIEHYLTINGFTATGTVLVPKGYARQFLVEGIDVSGILQFEAAVTQDILDDHETVYTGVTWLAPGAVAFEISSVRPYAVQLIWTPSIDPDIAFYRILLATTPYLDPNNSLHIVGDVIATGVNEIEITGLTPRTQYYVAVVAVDTEGLFDSDFSVEGFITTSPYVELAWDDGTAESSAWVSSGWLTGRFEPPSYPCTITSFQIWLVNKHYSSSHAAVVLWEEDGGDTLFTESVWLSTDGWVEFTPDWSSLPSSGVVTGPFHAGVDFGASIHISRIPAIGADTSSTYQAGYSWYRSPDGSWSQAHEAGPAWNFMIRTTVELLPERQQVMLLPVCISPPHHPVTSPHSLAHF